MNLPTVEQFLTKLEANPSEAAAFDAAIKHEAPHCKTRREACQHLLASLTAKTASLAAGIERKRQALLATKELEKANTALRSRHTANQSAPMKTTPSPKATTTPPAAPLIRKVTAAEYVGPKLIMDRAEFSKLTAQARQRFLSESGTIQ